MRFGIDFDNTIVCYDALFHRVAREDGWIPQDLPASKAEVRNHLRRIGREEVWTEMQGRVYGTRMAEATPYPGVLDFFRACRAAAVPVHIISHKTRTPILGEPVDLHAAALAWLEAHGFFDPARLALRRDQVFFEPTKELKLARIAACACTHFVDDLPEFLAEPGFPPGVERILFDPNRTYTLELRYRRVAEWRDLERLLPRTPTAPIAAAAFPEPSPAAPFPAKRLAPPSEPVAAFLHRAGIPPDAPRRDLPGGANNRVQRVDAGGRAYVLKAYFHSAADPRDRFGAERAFHSWIQLQGIRRTAQPLAWDPDHRLALFEFVDGRRLEPAEITEARLDEALAFVLELNAGRDRPSALPIPVASEGCFTLAEHLACVERRMARIGTLAPASPADQAALRFWSDELRPAWHLIRNAISATAIVMHDPPLEAASRCLSPSDFGFHNVLLAPDGSLKFFDFEYAGWDDPAKLLCDFFCQPALPVDLGHWARAVGALDHGLAWKGRLRERADLLLPAYRIKWCCILLNEFLADQARRAFAQGPHAAPPIEVLKERQLAKARKALALVVQS